MTWKELQKKTYSVTEKEYKVYTDEIIAIYQNAYIEVREELKKAYAQYLTGVDSTDYYNLLTKSKRLENLLDEITRTYVVSAQKAGKSQVTASTMAIANQYYRSLYAMQWAEEASTIFPVLSDRIIDYAVFGTVEAWKAFTPKEKELYKNMQHPTILKEILGKNRDADITRIRQTLISSLMTGESYIKSARNFRELFNGSLYNALRVARTEGTRLLNAGNYAVSQAMKDKGLDIVRAWDATLDTKTRPTHAAADGQREDENGMFHVGDAVGVHPGAMSKTDRKSVV